MDEYEKAFTVSHVFIFFDFDLAHTKIGFDFVYHFAIFQYPYLEVI